MKASSINIEQQQPHFRLLRGYAFDPSLSTKLETAAVNHATYILLWEEPLDSGPVGEYVEVIDFDPVNNCFYEPVDLNDSYLLAQNGLAAAEGNPQFHQQMVYAVAMTTIRNFERALGRRTFWSPRVIRKKNGKFKKEEYIQRLRIYPHAFQEANAYYSQNLKALLFGYFQDVDSHSGQLFPGGIVFTCLSHDIIAHETTHALLDGIRGQYVEHSNQDVPAFHEAFADIVALFQHFSYAEVLRHQIARTRGDLNQQNLLGELAQQFGEAIGHYGALRSAIGHVNPTTHQWEPSRPNPDDYDTVSHPHQRGAILVAAIFDAFLSIYKRRVADLLRIASNGSGILPEGELHPDLVKRLSDEAAKTSKHVLTMCIRALDYCPPIDITFGDYLRALITADCDLVPDDRLDYRVALVEAFRRRGIYARDIRTLSVDTLRWPLLPDSSSDRFIKKTEEILIQFLQKFTSTENREQVWNLDQRFRYYLDRILRKGGARKRAGLFSLLGLDPKGNFRITLLRPSQRIGPDGNTISQILIEILQDWPKKSKKRRRGGHRSELKRPVYAFQSGCTLVVEIVKLADNDKDKKNRKYVENGPVHRGLRSLRPQVKLQVRYCISKKIEDKVEQREEFHFLQSTMQHRLRDTYFSDENKRQKEQFALLHRYNHNE